MQLDEDLQQHFACAVDKLGLGRRACERIGCLGVRGEMDDGGARCINGVYEPFVVENTMGRHIELYHCGLQRCDPQDTWS